MRRKLFLYRGLCNTGIALAFGIIGPFNTFTYLSLPESLLYWSIFSFLAWAQGEAAIMWVTNWGPFVGRPLLLRVSVAIALIVIPVSFEIAVVETLLGLAIISPELSLSAYQLGMIYFRTFVIGLLVTYPWALFWRSFAGFDIWELSSSPPLKPTTVSTPAENPVTPPSAPTSMDPALIQPSPPLSQPRFLQSLVQKRGALLAIAQENNYLRLYFTQGSELLLYRLTDAIAELGTGIGLRVHRYWWVAHIAIVSLERFGSSAQLTLSNGLNVPVGRTYLPSLRQAGWALAEDKSSGTTGSEPSKF